MKFFLSILTLAPSIAFAQPQTFSQVVDTILNIGNLAMPFLVALALFIFISGLVKFLSRGGSEESVKEGKKLMLWGIIALFMMLSVWGIVRILLQSFGFPLGIPLTPRFLQ
ncbi:MAG: pilin [Patescibacteria group bacterium]